MSVYQKILLAYDGTAESAEALREGAEIAERCGAHTHLLAVVNMTPAFLGAETMDSGNYVATELERFQSVLEQAIRLLRQRGIKADGHLVQGSPPDEIVRAAKEFGADLVILGYHRSKGLRKWWHTPTCTLVIDRVPCSLLVAITSEGGNVPPAAEATPA
jgi:nucleotide-binding universal stress UspA family protein